MAISQLNFNHTLAEGGREIFSGKPCAFGFFGKWGSGEWGKWGSGGMGEFRLFWFMCGRKKDRDNFPET
jgi:hypothetical protein